MLCGRDRMWLWCSLGLSNDVKMHAQHVLRCYVRHMAALEQSRLRLQMAALKACLPSMQGAAPSLIVFSDIPRYLGVVPTNLRYRSSTKFGAA